MKKMTVVLAKMGMANQAGNKMTYATLLEAKAKLEKEGEILVTDKKGQYTSKIHRIWLNVGTLLAEVDKRDE
jgi:hypothetical protein